jgi:cleavage and polyadenylation specificity factor subunit 4
MPPEVKFGCLGIFLFIIIHLVFHLQQREAAQRNEEAKYRALGYINYKRPEMMQQTTDGTVPEMPAKPPPRPLEEITCFKCGTKGHYANKCTKGHLAFLSNNLSRK